MNIKYPKAQLVWLEFCIDGKPTYLVTSDVIRALYTLHTINPDGSLTKLRTGKDPQFKEVNPKSKGGE